MLYIEAVRLLSLCQLAASPWQRAGIRVPAQLPPPVWALEESPGPRREGLLDGWGGDVCACVGCVLSEYNMWGWGAVVAWEEGKAGGAGSKLGQISATGRGCCGDGQVVMALA